MGKTKPQQKPRSNRSQDDKRFGPKKSYLDTENISYIDYKDIDILSKFMSDRAKIKAREMTGNNSQQQKELARAVKNAREMGLLSYTSRVTTQRKSRDDRDDGDNKKRYDKDGGKDSGKDSGKGDHDKADSKNKSDADASDVENVEVPEGVTVTDDQTFAAEAAATKEAASKAAPKAEAIAETVAGVEAEKVEGEE